MTAREPDIAEAVSGPQTTHEEGAPAGAPASAAEQHRVPAGDPEAPVGPVASVKSESVAREHGMAGAASEAEQAAAAQPEAAAAADQTDATDHERELEYDIEQLTAKAEKAEEYLELAQRARADFENYRKRAAREAAVAQERGIAKLAKELLPAVDNLDRALEAAQSAMAPTADGAPTDNGTATLISGIKLVHEDVISALARAGIERFSPAGEKFDPQQHEAIAQQPVEGKESGTVVEVYQSGYRLGEVVIRPARVVVAA